MKQMITALIVACAAALSGSAVANDMDDNIKFSSSADIKSAAPAQTSPQAEPEADPETELMLFSVPDVVNRPPR